MDPLHAIAIAIIQGATELFPVSSLGHAVVLPRLFGWQLDEHTATFLPFLVMLHVGTSAALLAFFWRDWWALLLGVLGIGGPHAVAEGRRVFRLVVVATIPAVVVGGTLEHVLRHLFSTPLIAAGFLALNGVMLIAGERLRTRGRRPLSTLRPADALVIGIWQCLALLPGLSRSGATMIGGLLRGLDHEGAAHFSFLIATPIILGATVLEVPKLLHASVPPGTLPLAIVSAIVAGVMAWLSTWLLMRWYRHNDVWSLAPFGWYCIVFGVAAGAYIVMS